MFKRCRATLVFLLLFSGHGFRAQSAVAQQPLGDTTHRCCKTVTYADGCQEVLIQDSDVSVDEACQDLNDHATDRASDHGGSYSLSDGPRLVCRNAMEFPPEDPGFICYSRTARPVLCRGRMILRNGDQIITTPWIYHYGCSFADARRTLRVLLTDWKCDPEEGLSNLQGKFCYEVAPEK
jgi:hypothetical protein